MTDAAPRPCLTPLCTGTPKPEWAWCPPCAERVIENALSGGPVARSNRPVEAEWVKRMRANRGVSKDFTSAVR